jgi:RNA polymerase sigma-70 factor (ECF subfamily)
MGSRTEFNGRSIVHHRPPAMRWAVPSRRPQNVAILSASFKAVSLISSSGPQMSLPHADHGEWQERFRPYLTLLARHHLCTRLPSKLDASDIVQQTMLDAFAKRDQFRGTTDGELLAWLREILKNNLANTLRDQRRDKRDVRREQPLDIQIDESFCRTHDCLVSVQSSPSQRIVRQEEVLRLAEVIARLPDDQREVIVLHHLEGLTLSHLAEHLQRSESAVAGLLHRGLKKLRELMTEKGEA